MITVCPKGYRDHYAKSYSFDLATKQTQRKRNSVSYHYFATRFYEAGIDEFGFFKNIITALYRD